MNDALADSFMAPLREAQTRLAQLREEITNKQRELTALETECATCRRAMNTLRGRCRIAVRSQLCSRRINPHPKCSRRNQGRL
jgi:hypothetical protein